MVSDRYPEKVRHQWGEKEGDAGEKSSKNLVLNVMDIPSSAP